MLGDQSRHKHFCPQRTTVAAGHSSTATLLIRVVPASKYKIRSVFEDSLFQHGKKSREGKNM